MATGDIVYKARSIKADNLQDALKIISEELNRIEIVLELVRSGYISKTYAPPERVEDGIVRFADGTQWDPGSGEGAYIYYSAGWHLLG